MLALSHFVNKNQVLRGPNITSKKRMFEVLSFLLASADYNEVSENIIYQNLHQRERIGSTAVGKGVVLPHCRIEGLSITRIAFVVLNKPIDYDTPDGEPADIFVGLIFPHNARDVHLSFLSRLVTLLRQDEFRAQLRATEDNKALYELLQNANTYFPE